MNNYVVDRKDLVKLLVDVLFEPAVGNLGKCKYNNGLVEAKDRINALQKYGSDRLLAEVINRVNDKIEAKCFEEEYCIKCLRSCGLLVKMEEHMGAHEYMGDYGSAKAYQYIVYSIKCPVCDHIEEC